MTRLPTRYVNLEQARVRFGDRVDRVGAFLQVGDALADAAVAALARTERAQMFAWIDEGCTQGSAALSAQAPTALREFFVACEHTPAWVDRVVIERGGEVVLRAGLLAGLVLGARSIVLGYASPGGNKPLVFAGGLTERAARRLNETARYVRSLIVPGGLNRFAEGYGATLRVRLMHAHVRASLMARPDWRLEAWGVPINQHDMAATTLLFSLVLIDGLRKLGMRVLVDDEEAYCHLWRYAGYLMGVDQELLPTSAHEGRRLWALIEATQAPPDDDSRALVAALCAAVEAEGHSPREKRAATRALHLLRTVAHVLHGDELAAQLGFARSPLGAASTILPHIVRSADVLARRLPQAQLQAGRKYWDAFGQVGHQRYGTPFRY